MMSIILFEYTKHNINNILEIGGGYGGWLNLNYKIQNFNSWHIIDLPHLNILQEWFLSKNNVPNNKYKLIQNTNYKNLIKTNYDIIIGSHSLSEFSLDIFKDYYNNLIKNTKYFFYAYHKYLPATDLINEKLNIINEHFDLIIDITSENNNVSNCIYLHKNL